MTNARNYLEIALICLLSGSIIGFLYGHKRGYGIGRQDGYLRRRRENAAAK